MRIWDTHVKISGQALLALHDEDLLYEIKRENNNQ